MLTALTTRTALFLVLSVLMPACLWCGWRYDSKACDWASAMMVVVLFFAFYAK